MSEHRRVFDDFAEEAEELLEDSLEEIYLYGSVAREEESEDSDIDVFAVVDSRRDLRRLRDLAYSMGVLENGVVISVQGRTVDSFEGFSETSYLRNIESEGVKRA